jgi:hypothetical protein
MESTLHANIVYMDQDTICIEFHHALNVSYDALETRILAEDNSFMRLLLGCAMHPVDPGFEVSGSAL